MTDNNPNDSFALTPATANFGGFSVEDDVNRVLSRLHGIQDLNSVKRDIRNLRNFKRSFINDSHQVNDLIGEFDSHSETYEAAHYTVLIKTNSPELKPPPPPKDKCCMRCCPPQDDSLLRLLLQKVNKLSTIVGVDEYPATLPSSLITKSGGFIDGFQEGLNNPDGSDTVQIPSLTKLFAWYIERFDEILGQWEIPIDIQDADATQEGDQSKHIRLPNLAEAIAEMVLLLTQISINSESLVNMSTRTLLETGMNKQQGFKNYYMLDTLIDYFGFQTKDTNKKLALTFKPGEEDLEKLLKETEIDVRITELDDKNTFKANMQDLLHAAAIIRAVHWRKFGKDDDIKGKLIGMFKGYSAINSMLSGNQKDENNKDDFDKFLDDAERGFIDTSGITDSTHPYGRNLSERPQIRRIGNQTPTQDT